MYLLSRVANKGNSESSWVDRGIRGSGQCLLGFLKRKPIELNRCKIGSKVAAPGDYALRSHVAEISIQRERIFALASRVSVPMMSDTRSYVEAGGLISYGPSLAGMWRQVGIYVGKIIKDTKPDDLPVQQPTTFVLVINLKTANALGLNVPSSILTRADEVID